MIPNDLIESFIDSSLAGITDKTGEWTIKSEKSSKTCVSPGNCTFIVSFSRPFAAEANSDYSITQGENALYEAYTYATEYSTGFGSNRATEIYQVSEPQVITLENVAATYKYA